MMEYQPWISDRFLKIKTCDTDDHFRFLSQGQEAESFSTFQIGQFEMILLQVSLQTVVFRRIVGQITTLNPEEIDIGIECR